MHVQEDTWTNVDKRKQNTKKSGYLVLKKLLYKFYEALSGQVALAMSRFLMILFYKVHTSP